jgi:hypothetical protein
MTLESLTLQQIVRFANSGDIERAEFGHRVLRLMNLAAQTVQRSWDIDEIRNLDKVLRANLANYRFVAHLLAEFFDRPVETVTVPPRMKTFKTWLRQIENADGEGTLSYFDIAATDEDHVRWICARTLPHCKVERIEQLAAAE